MCHLSGRAAKREDRSDECTIPWETVNRDRNSEMTQLLISKGRCKAYLQLKTPPHDSETQSYWSRSHNSMYSLSPSEPRQELR
jgi:hypothetical protein